MDMCIDRQFGSLSAGQQRLVLLCRALLKCPPVLILDEPFQCLDTAQVARAQHLLDNLPNDTTLLFVTHYTHEIPAAVTQFLRLEKGKVYHGVTQRKIALCNSVVNLTNSPYPPD